GTTHRRAAPRAAALAHRRIVPGVRGPWRTIGRSRRRSARSPARQLIEHLAGDDGDDGVDLAWTHIAHARLPRFVRGLPFAAASWAGVNGLASSSSSFRPTIR